MKKFLQALCAAVVLVASMSASHAVDGQTDSGNAFPFTVRQFSLVGEEVSSCTAILVSPWMALTAAHCIYGDGDYVDDVAIQYWDEVGRQDRLVQDRWVWVPKGYQDVDQEFGGLFKKKEFTSEEMARVARHDIGVIILSAPARVSKYATMPINVSDSIRNLLVGRPAASSEVWSEDLEEVAREYINRALLSQDRKRLFVVGYGARECVVAANGESVCPSDLQRRWSEVILRTDTEFSGGSIFQTSSGSSDSPLSGSRSVVLPGDSGGGLLIPEMGEWILVGIHSARDQEMSWEASVLNNAEFLSHVISSDYYQDAIRGR